MKGGEGNEDYEGCHRAVQKRFQQPVVHSARKSVDQSRNYCLLLSRNLRSHTTAQDAIKTLRILSGKFIDK